MELAQKTNTTATEVQPHNEHTATKESPQQSIDIEERRQQQQKQQQEQQQNRESKSATPQPLDESTEDINWPRLVVSSDEEEKKIAVKQQKQAQLITKKSKSVDNHNSNINSEEEEEQAAEVYKNKGKEEVEGAENIFELDNFVVKRKRYEVSRLGSEEILLGCNEADGEACLVSKSEDLIEYNNMADGKNLSSENATTSDETYAPAAKRLKKSPEKFSPRRDEIKRQTSKQEQAHVVGDAEEARHQNNTSLTKTRGNANSKHAANANAAKQLSAQDDFYKKPFEYGWKRELVWRATPESGRERADVYFISPAGKKIRTRHDILPLLQGDLKMEHFCWLREAVGVGPEYETVRNAKPNPNRASTVAVTLAAMATSTPTPVTGKRMPKPKGPKGASPPPEGWTPTRALKVNNAALNSRSSIFGGFGGSSTPSVRSSSNASTRSASNKKKPTNSVVVGGGGVNHMLDKMVAKEATDMHQHKNQNTIIDGNLIKSSSHASNRQGCEPCTIMCSRAPGLIPQLQCVKCLCLYHHQCVGLNPNTTIFRRSDGTSGRDYICESCNPKLKTDLSPKKASTTPAVSNNTSATTTIAIPTTATATPLPINVKTTTTTAAATSIFKDKKSINKNITNIAAIKSTSSPTSSRGSVNSSNSKRNNNNSSNSNNKLPQSIAVVKGKKYVVVEKTRNNKSKQQNEYANDIENDLKQINESIRNSLPTQPALAKLEAAQQLQQQNAIALSAAMQQHYARNVFANMSYTFDSLLIILKYLKIHERMRFASVCKMWHAAANSRFVWQTVRLKNSKVYNWSGCAAALQRNGTKHLDMRKMLFPSARADETWTDFSKHIVQACFLEIIDLCRCPARVVESLFKSNHNLRVLNAITINDDAINLEHIHNLTNLEELRLRTNEPAVLTNDLKPLSTLTKLTHLSLTGIRSLGNKHVESLENLTALRNLELGECGALSETFAQVVLTKLTQLQRLRLENGQDTACDTLSILEAITTLPQLNQLELVNFDVRPGFEERLKQCLALNKLLIIPTYLSQSATTNQTVLEAVQGIAAQLKVFTWGVTVELLRVTALYVDQCDESSKKEKHNFDECIPVLKPVPGASAIDGHDTDMDNSGSTNNISATETEANVNNDVPQIEILPLDKVERILAANIPNTKFQIVKVPYHATCKQQLVE